jgi:hypothetical protein
MYAVAPDASWSGNRQSGTFESVDTALPRRDSQSSQIGPWKTKRPGSSPGRFLLLREALMPGRPVLELVPEELVIDLVVELHFLGLDEGAEQARAAIG